MGACCEEAGEEGKAEDVMEEFEGIDLTSEPLSQDRVPPSDAA